eukprot:CAMPEP_0119119526 /NCGR_PEP_ID=MMETSP1310-20130426/979_1 /TAXON_ID=464262 /ORGANISM="Genus nov. species nov., Strain RCC2339" /LENGTH=379 /DNA_ID=CAMNT_0007108967 /DNA_START=32 /DNA_END=1168 /DNA_ORIENTATION=+
MDFACKECRQPLSQYYSRLYLVLCLFHSVQFSKPTTTNQSTSDLHTVQDLNVENIIGRGARTTTDVQLRPLPSYGSTTDGVIRLLICTSLGKQAIHEYVSRMATYMNWLNNKHWEVQFFLNVYRSSDYEVLSSSIDRYGVRDLLFGNITSVPGAKASFWIHSITPSVTSVFDYVMLLDEDLGFAVHEFHLARLLDIATTLNLSLFSPLVMTETAKDICHNWTSIKIVEDESLRRFSAPQMQKRIQIPGEILTFRPVAVEVCNIEMVTPVFHRNFFDWFRATALKKVSNSIQSRSNWGIDKVWCDAVKSYLLSKNDAAAGCTIIPDSPIVHLDFRTFPHNGRREVGKEAIHSWRVFARKNHWRMTKPESNLKCHPGRTVW